MATVAVFVFYVFTHLLVLYSAEEDGWGKWGNSTKCPAYFCNKIVGNIFFPFKSERQPPECGLYSVDCSNSSSLRIQLREGGYWYQLESITRSNSVLINDGKLQERVDRLPCNDEVFNDLSLPRSSPVLNISTKNLTLFRCNNTLYKIPYKGPTYACSNSLHTYYTVSNDSLACTAIQIPIVRVSSSNIYDPSALTANFSLQVQFTKECEECYKRNGKCFDDNGKFRCDRLCWNARWEFNCTLAAQEGKCRDKKDARKCKKGYGRLVLKLGIGVVAGVMSAVIFFCCFLWNKKNQSRQMLEAFLLSKYGPLQVKRYSYSDIKKMTNSFKIKLGQGGYGGVYKGELKDGRLVAVKVLNRSKGDGEEFMNEVAAISRTSHVNIVSLLGFCFECSKRALIYEFMPNGSLEKFIFGANKPKKDDHLILGWEALERISLGIARGLEYLHRGCNIRILHFDIKPHNILLDENFLPKISDFGLAKICDRKESIVSMMCARGTAGYIAPEVFSRNFGGVSHKSDVYSYGMMLSEIVGGRRNINAEVENTSEIYFPHWIYNRLELNEELGLQSITSEEDKVRARKMIIVSLWCIQTDPSNRPAMKEVIEMLEGSLESLQMPPKPYLSSPPKSPAVADSSTTLVSLQ